MVIDKISVVIEKDELEELNPSANERILRIVVHVGRERFGMTKHARIDDLKSMFDQIWELMGNEIKLGLQKGNIRSE